VTNVRNRHRDSQLRRSKALDQVNPDDMWRPAGIFVFTSSPGVVVGDSVLVSGTVKDFYPLASGETTSRTAQLSVTEIDSPAIVLSPATSCGARVIGASTVPDACPGSGGNIESTQITPSRSALDYWESREGMRVEVDDARVVGPSNSFGEQYVTSKPSQDETFRGGTELLAENAIPSGRIEVVPADGSNPHADVGDVFQGPTVGPVDYSEFGGYMVAATMGTASSTTTWRQRWPPRRQTSSSRWRPTTSRTWLRATPTRSSSGSRPTW
jgi:hypothetical protein